MSKRKQKEKSGERIKDTERMEIKKNSIKRKKGEKKMPNPDNKTKQVPVPEKTFKCGRNKLNHHCLCKTLTCHPVTLSPCHPSHLKVHEWQKWKQTKKVAGRLTLWIDRLSVLVPCLLAVTNIQQEVT